MAGFLKKCGKFASYFYMIIIGIIMPLVLFGFGTYNLVTAEDETEERKISKQNTGYIMIGVAVFCIILGWGVWYGVQKNETFAKIFCLVNLTS